MKKIYVLEYDFLGVACHLEYGNLHDFAKKLDAVMEMPEVLEGTIQFHTEDRL